MRECVVSCSATFTRGQRSVLSRARHRGTEQASVPAHPGHDGPQSRHIGSSGRYEWAVLHTRTRKTPDVEGPPERPVASKAERVDAREPHPVAGPAHERRSDDGASLADGFRKAEPYMAASSTLVASVIGFTALGYWLDRKMGHSVQWLLLVGAVVGMLVGFVSFFRKVLGSGARR
jgi:ATP synthase protein I